MVVLTVIDPWRFDALDREMRRGLSVADTGSPIDA